VLPRGFNAARFDWRHLHIAQFERPFPKVSESCPPPPNPLPPRAGVLLLVSTNPLSLVEDPAFSVRKREGKGEGDRPIGSGQLLPASPSEVVLLSEPGENRSIQVLVASEVRWKELKYVASGAMSTG